MINIYLHFGELNSSSRRSKSSQECSSWNQTGSLSASPLASQVALDKPLTLFEPPFPHYKIRVRMPYRITMRIKQGSYTGNTQYSTCAQQVLNKYLIFLTFPLKILFDNHSSKSYLPLLLTGEMKTQSLTQDTTIHSYQSDQQTQFPKSRLLLTRTGLSPLLEQDTACRQALGDALGSQGLWGQQSGSLVRVVAVSLSSLRPTSAQPLLFTHLASD